MQAHTIHNSARSRHLRGSIRYTGTSSIKKLGSSLHLSISLTITAVVSCNPPLPIFPLPPLFHSKALLSTKLSVSCTFGHSFGLALHHWCRLQPSGIPQSDTSGVEYKQLGACQQETKSDITVQSGGV